MSDHLQARLDAPAADLETLSFSASSPSAIADWVAGLPLANITETASKLKQASAELAQLNAPAALKFDCIEIVRPVVHYVCSRLDRQRSKEAGKETTAQDLLLGLCSGYKAVALQLMPAPDREKKDRPKGNNREALPKSIHRLMSDLSRVLLRSLQKYTQPPQNYWWELNEVFRLSEALELTQFRLTDDENHSPQSISIEVAYLRSLLLSTCKPNQLQKADIGVVFNALEYWGDQVVLGANVDDALLVVDLLANHGPRYIQTSRKTGEPRALRTEVLAYEIEAYLNGVNTTITIPDSLPNELLKHLISAWTVVKDRSFNRLSTDTPMRLCVGLSAAHYFLSGGVEFSEQIATTDALLRREVNPFLDVDYEATSTEEEDPWSHAHDLKVRIPENPNIQAPESILLQQPRKPRPTTVFEHIEAQSVDTSPGGYQVQLIESGGTSIAVGELVALREEADTRWCIASVRWISQDRGFTRMGLALLAPKAIPVALRTIKKIGGPTDYARGLLLPEISAIKQTATLITPCVPFRSGHKVNVHRQGLQSTAQLLESQQKTESFNQFTFRLLDGYLEN